MAGYRLKQDIDYKGIMPITVPFAERIENQQEEFGVVAFYSRLWKFIPKIYYSPAHGIYAIISGYISALTVQI